MPTKILNPIYPVTYPNLYLTPSPISHMLTPLSHPIENGQKIRAGTKIREGGRVWEREKVVNEPQGTCELLHVVQMDNAYSQPPKFSLPSILIKN